MNEISFKSTYKIPMFQPGVKKGQRTLFKSYLNMFENTCIGTDSVRLSIPHSEDATFIEKIKELGYKMFLKFDAENLNKTEIDKYISEQIKAGNYKSIGKETKSTVKKTGEKTEKKVKQLSGREIERRAAIMQTEEYKRIEQIYGKDEAAAIYFMNPRK